MLHLLSSRVYLKAGFLIVNVNTDGITDGITNINSLMSTSLIFTLGRCCVVYDYPILFGYPDPQTLTRWFGLPHVLYALFTLGRTVRLCMAMATFSTCRLLIDRSSMLDSVDTMKCHQLVSDILLWCSDSQCESTLTKEYLPNTVRTDANYYFVVNQFLCQVSKNTWSGLVSQVANEGLNGLSLMLNSGIKSVTF